MKLARRCAAVCLSAALLLSPAALAADPEGSTASGRLEDLNQLYDTLKTGHPNLFTNTPEPAFLARKAEIEGRLETVSDLEFAMDLQTLAALAGDSHTTTSISSDNMHFFPFALKWFDGAWVLSTVPAADAAQLGKTVTALNGVPMAEAVARFGRLISADNPVKLRRQARQMLYAEEILSYLGLAQPGEALTLTLADGETVVMDALGAEEMDAAEFSYLFETREGEAATEYDKTKYYFSLPLDENTYYIQYNRCQEDPELSMEDFAARVEADLSAGSYSQVLLDLRYNGGGSDGVIRPLLDLLAPGVRSGAQRLYGLVGESTFSSAIINAVMITEMGGVLAGTPTSGSVNHFGATRPFTLANSGIRVSCSTKWIALDSLLETGRGYGVEPIRPGVAVEPTLADYLAGKDTEVEYLLAHGDEYQAPDRSADALTKGRFLTELMEAAKAAGKDVSAPDREFQDMPISFAYYVPAVNWAAQNGLVQGDPQGTLGPVRTLTRAEAAVLLKRCADYLGVDLPTEETAFSDAADIPAWALDAARWAVGAGLLEAEAGAFRPNAALTRGEGAGLAAALN